MAEKYTDADVVDGVVVENSPRGTPRRQIDLRTLEQVRQEMARVYRFVDKGRIESAEGSKRVYMLAQIGKIIEVAQLEERIRLLEDRQLRRIGNGQIA